MVIWDQRWKQVKFQSSVTLIRLLFPCKFYSVSTIRRSFSINFTFFFKFVKNDLFSSDVRKTISTSKIWFKMNVGRLMLTHKILQPPSDHIPLKAALPDWGYFISTYRLLFSCVFVRVKCWIDELFFDRIVSEFMICFWVDKLIFILDMPTKKSKPAVDIRYDGV